MNWWQLVGLGASRVAVGGAACTQQQYLQSGAEE